MSILYVISALKKKGLLTEVDRATYRVNLNIIGKGDWRDILNLRKRISKIKVNIVYNEQGRNIVAETVTEEVKEETGKNV